MPSDNKNETAHRRWGFIAKSAIITAIVTSGFLGRNVFCEKEVSDEELGERILNPMIRENLLAMHGAARNKETQLTEVTDLNSLIDALPKFILNQLSSSPGESPFNNQNNVELIRQGLSDSSDKDVQTFREFLINEKRPTKLGRDLVESLLKPPTPGYQFSPKNPVASPMDLLKQGSDKSESRGR